MKFSLEEPFKNMWNRAYLRISKDGRKRVDLYNSVTDRTTISFARYLVSVKEGRLLLDTEEVDHIDGNCSNDAPENLQLLPIQLHRIKTMKEKRGRSYHKLRCPNCRELFLRPSNKVRSCYKLVFCDLSCSAKFWHKFKNEDAEFINLIREEQVIQKFVIFGDERDK